MTRVVDAVVIGGGSPGSPPATTYAAWAWTSSSSTDPTPGGAWQHTWDSLHLFSPAAYSSLPGRLMPPRPGETCPDAAHVVSYLTDYEQRYDLPVHRPVHVARVRDGELLRVESDSGTWRAGAVISAPPAPGPAPSSPRFPGVRTSRAPSSTPSSTRRPADFVGQRAIVVGVGDSGAQIAADRAYDADLAWVMLREPRYLADGVDDRALFAAATARRRALDEGRTDTGGVASLGDIVAVPPVSAARAAGLLKAQPTFDRITPTGVVRVAAARPPERRMGNTVPGGGERPWGYAAGSRPACLP